MKILIKQKYKKQKFGIISCIFNKKFPESDNHVDKLHDYLKRQALTIQSFKESIEKKDYKIARGRLENAKTYAKVAGVKIPKEIENMLKGIKKATNTMSRVKNFFMSTLLY